MRLNELSQVTALSPSDLVLIWAAGNSQTRTAPFSVVVDAARQAVADQINSPGGLAGIGAAASGFNNDITGLGGIKTSRVTTDLNSADASGWFLTSVATSNQPEAKPFLVWHQQGNSTAAAQIAISLSTAKKYSRKYSVPEGVTGAVPVWSAWLPDLQQGGAISVTAITGLTTPLSVDQGGTGANTAANARTSLGATSTGNAVFTAASTTAARTAIGATTIGSGLMTAADAAAARLLLMTTVGAGIVTQGTTNDALTYLGFTAQARRLIGYSTGDQVLSEIGATATGTSLVKAADAAAAQTAIGATAVGASLITAADAGAGRTAIGAAPNAAPTATVRGTVLQSAAIADIAAAPTQADYNALLGALRTSGLLATA